MWWLTVTQWTSYLINGLIVYSKQVQMRRSSHSEECFILVHAKAPPCPVYSKREGLPANITPDGVLLKHGLPICQSAVMTVIRFKDGERLCHKSSCEGIQTYLGGNYGGLVMSSLRLCLKHWSNQHLNGFPFKKGKRKHLYIKWHQIEKYTKRWSYETYYNLLNYQ